MNLIQTPGSVFTSAVMALLWQMYELLVNLRNFSSGFSNFIKSFIKIFETSVEYICCEIISADGIAGGQAVR